MEATLGFSHRRLDSGETQSGICCDESDSLNATNGAVEMDIARFLRVYKSIVSIVESVCPDHSATLI